ncbi:Bifunctional inhibitor/lipid-transfer protein/seed storage 2S albumin superfamily protein [Abeliophyllum distichum]|uniref:Bifunctional inhibitor/lipid-transfer protein/seed storage 2S albumin superfamily protein n=1 Tax=Abeliophyllum distichum TaxID=126358 RepID=A0ABD1PE39_9LAMI
MPSLSNIALILLLFISLSPNTFSQSTGIEQCSSNLLPLAPCLPFVQGAMPLPVQSCCDYLKQVDSQQPTCLCLLLNETTLSSFPINTTLALQLPLLCNLQMSNSNCTGTPLPSTSPTSQVPSGPKPNSTVAASPLVTAMPRQSILGFGLHQNAGLKLKAQDQFVIILLMAISSVFTSILT